MQQYEDRRVETALPRSSVVAETCAVVRWRRRIAVPLRQSCCVAAAAS
jgi:hypothetical protein